MVLERIKLSIQAGLQQSLRPQFDVRKYESYEISTKPDQNHKADEIRLCSFERPHMRAFHCAWWSFFVAFFIWFAIVPLLPQIKKDLNMTGEEMWTSAIANFSGTFLVRILLGPLCDRYGPRILFSFVLFLSAIPTACLGFVNTVNGLIVLRLFIGFSGGSFVMCQFWISNMFCKEVVGSANALAGGWGNLGAIFTQLMVGNLLYPGFVFMFHKLHGSLHQEDDSFSDSELDTTTTSMTAEEWAWRTVSIIPAIVAFATGIIIFYISDDSPRGNFAGLRKVGKIQFPSLDSSLKRAVYDVNTWVLFIQYATCFGVELAINGAASLYFREKFGLSLASANAVGALFGWMNLFARGMGGGISDGAMAVLGMIGRFRIQVFFLLMEGTLLLILPTIETLSTAIAVLVMFSLFVQAAEGSTYGIVPYVQPQAMGSVSGIVGAGGTAGAVIYTMAFREWGLERTFKFMGVTIIISSLLTYLMKIKGRSGLLCGKDWPINPETGEILELVDEEEGHSLR